MANEYQVSATFTPGDPTKPVISAPVLGTPGTAGVTITLTSDLVGGIIHPRARLATSPKLTATEIISGTGLAVGGNVTDTSPTADDQNSVAVNGLSASLDYVVDVVQESGSGVLSDIISTAQFQTAADAGAAVLTSPTGSSSVVCEYVGSVDTDQAAGTIHWMLSANSAPEAPSTILRHNTIVVSGAGTVSVTGFGASEVAGVSRYLHYMHRLPNGLLSNVVVSPVFTMSSTYGTKPIEDVQIISQDKRLTQPNWMTEKRPGKLVTIGALPAGCTYSPSNNVITVAASATNVILDGWDLKETETGIEVEAGAHISRITNIAFGADTLNSSTRWDVYQNAALVPPAPLRLKLPSGGKSTTIDYIGNCSFDCGSRGGAARGDLAKDGVIRIETDTVTGLDHSIGLLEFCRIIGFTRDGMKAAVQGKFRYLYIDSPANHSSDAVAWQAATPYPEGTAVYGPAPGHFLRVCRVNGTTVSPDWTGKVVYTPEWTTADPHTDGITIPHSRGPLDMDYCFINREGKNRMAKNKSPDLSYSSGFLPNANSTGPGAGLPVGAQTYRGCIVTGDDDQYASYCVQLGNTTASLTMQDSFWSGPTDRWIQNLGTGVSEVNTTYVGLTGSTLLDPATISNEAANYDDTVATPHVAYGFSSTGPGWMNVVISTSNTMTDDEVYWATQGGSIVAVAECNVGTGLACLDDIEVTLSSGTYYVHGLFEHSGQRETRAATQTIVVP